MRDKTHAVAYPVVGLIVMFILMGCHKDNPAKNVPLTFGIPQRVTVVGYNGNSMEPFLSRDGQILFFNNLNSAPENTNLHWSLRVNDSTFQYQGEISGVNTPALEGVATMDDDGDFYFISNRSYDQTLASIYTGHFSNGALSDVTLVDGISKNETGWINFDVEVDPPGTHLYFVDGRFDSSGGPSEADFVIAEKNGSSFQRMQNSSEIMKNINTSALEYAACISADGLEFYFTRVETPVTGTSVAAIYYARRENSVGVFDAPVLISSITGFVEAPTISPDSERVYYHKKENGLFVIYFVRRL